MQVIFSAPFKQFCHALKKDYFKKHGLLDYKTPDSMKKFTLNQQQNFV
jgi:hypothetical protein